jgi:branched-chain amino acid transport system substrate-binding protein
LRHPLIATSGCVVLAAFGVAACGGSSSSSGGGGGSSSKSKSVTIYSSLPLQGASRGNSEAVNNGAKLALQAVGGKVNGYTVSFKNLDDSTASAGKWDPGQTQSNARKAVQDKSTVAYIGEFNSGATANSLPILNEAGIPQVSPSNTAQGLTAKGLGSAPGEPDKYYPSGKRTYARVVPRDAIQGAADVQAMKDDGCKKIYIVNDKEVYGQGLATVVQQLGPKQGMQVVGNDGYDPKASNYRSLASKIAGKGTDCFFGSIIVDNNGSQLFKDVASGVPNAKLYGPDGVAEDTFTDPKQGGIPASIASRVKITVATLSQDKYPPAGQKLLKDYQTTYKKKPETYAIYGYEAMSLILDAMKRAGSKANDRSAVNDQIHQTKDKQSVLGTYSIDKNGDTSLTDYGLYTVKGGTLVFDKVIKQSGA